MQGAQQKVYVLEPTEIRTNSNGLSFGIATVLCKATNYNKVHDLFFPEKFIAKLSQWGGLWFWTDTVWETTAKWTWQILQR